MDMINILLDIVWNYGLFVGLVVWVLYDAHKREQRLVENLKEIREYLYQIMKDHN